MAKNNSTSTPIQLPLILEGKTVSILLTKGFVTIVDAIDANLLQYKWCAQEDHAGIVYARHREYLRDGSGKSHYWFLHRVIMERVAGRKLERHELVDHVDHDGLNNQRSNLRIATTGQNQRNKRDFSHTSKYRGVSWYKRYGLWVAQFSLNSKKYTVGYFKTEEEAHKAYEKRKKEIVNDGF